jgi:hypothetical protein
MPEEIKANPKAPEAEFEVEHVYGYRNDVVNNLYYTDKGEAVFMSGALGVVMETTERRQRVYGGK